eukprot:jgi/Hompol1/878/HPOL_005444-RA
MAAAGSSSGLSPVKPSRTTGRYSDDAMRTAAVAAGPTDTSSTTLRKKKSAKSLYDAKPSTTVSPIGITVRGFADTVKIAGLIQAFSGFGEITNVGFDSKKTSAFIDFENPTSAYAVMEHHRLHGDAAFTGLSEISLRFDKSAPETPDNAAAVSATSTAGPSTGASGSLGRHHRRQDSFDADSDSFTLACTLHISNCPQSIQKSELEAILCLVSDVKRFRIHQRPVERRVSAYITFKSPDAARKALSTLGSLRPPVLHNLAEMLSIEFPAKEIPRQFNSPDTTWRRCDTNQDTERRELLPPGSKKSKKTATAENRIVYVRQVAANVTTLEMLKETFGAASASIQSCHLLHKPDASMLSSAFVVFDMPATASSAIATKLAGCTLPRHKRVDLPRVPLSITVSDVCTYLCSAGDIKQILLPQEYESEVPTVMVEFQSAMGAAKAIVHCRENIPAFGRDYILADYSPSNKKDDRPELDADRNSLDLVHLSETGSALSVVESDTRDVVTLKELSSVAAQAGASVHLIEPVPTLVTLSELSAHRKPAAAEPEESIVTLAELASVSHSHPQQLHGITDASAEESISLADLTLHASPAARVAIAAAAAAAASSTTPAHLKRVGSIAEATEETVSLADLSYMAAKPR